MTCPYSIRGGYWAPTGMIRRRQPGGWWKYKTLYRWHFYDWRTEK